VLFRWKAGFLRPHVVHLRTLRDYPQLLGACPPLTYKRAACQWYRYSLHTTKMINVGRRSRDSSNSVRVWRSTGLVAGRVRVRWPVKMDCSAGNWCGS
jgi:hypothetical protein